MDAEARRCAEKAIAGLDAILETGAATPHEEVAETVRSVVAFRDRIIALTRQGAASPEMRDRANAAVSLAYGSENPVAGFHRHRLERTRHTLRELLEDGV